MEPEAPQKTTFTDHEALRGAIDNWQRRDWAFEAYVLVVPALESPYMVAGTNPLSCQMLADAAVRACCNASQRFTAAGSPTGRLSKAWTGTVCDLSALRDETHPRNTVAAAILMAFAMGEKLPIHIGSLYGTVGFHVTGELPQVIEAGHAVRLLKMATGVWRSHPNSPAQG